MALPVNRDARHCVVALQADDGDLFRDISRVYVSRVSRALDLAVIDVVLSLGRDREGSRVDRNFRRTACRGRCCAVLCIGHHAVVIISSRVCLRFAGNHIFRTRGPGDFRAACGAASCVLIPLIGQCPAIAGRSRHRKLFRRHCVAVGPA